MKSLFFVALLSVTLFACNCHYDGSGYVLDKITRQPIEGARVEIASNVPGKDTLAPHLYTDTNGYFSYSHDFCLDMVTIYKKDYIAHTLHPQGDTILLEVLIGN